MVLEQPLHAVSGTSFLVGGQRNDDVPIGDVFLFAHAHDDSEVNRALVFVIGDATAKEGPVFLDELERRQRPVLGLCFDHIDVRQQQDRLLPGAAAAKPSDEVAFFRRILEDDNVGVRESERLEPSRHGLSRGERAPLTLCRVNLDQLLEEAASDGIPFGLLGAGGCAADQQNRDGE